MWDQRDSVWRYGTPAQFGGDFCILGDWERRESGCLWRGETRYRTWGLSSSQYNSCTLGNHATSKYERLLIKGVGVVRSAELPHRALPRALERHPPSQPDEQRGPRELPQAGGGREQHHPIAILMPLIQEALPSLQAPLMERRQFLDEAAAHL